MAKHRRGDQIPELPPELQEYNPADGWVSWQEWSRARGSAMYKLGIRRLPSVQARSARAVDAGAKHQGGQRR